MDLVFNLNVLIIIYTVQAYDEPVGYIGCFDDGGGQQLPIRLKSSDTNSGDECKQRCKGYRYAGTKAANQCHCGTTLMNTRTGTRCTLKCTGNQNEICGGVSHISIYDNWNCVKQPCGNNAIKCTDNSASDYVCTCREGWTGRNCSEGQLLCLDN
ncbi:sialate:O-sulfotransferase 1-like [Ruditapes philippinarum]|uniref:sialate:O-sulfotransferase 1-like n=1 Tax=Ruditapes philippinarum TaxID=129788 RepID=UPI00295B9B81|nr:sialate:O-sulfotransferase 1-like [Ruditapes philippinarum]